MHVAVWLCGRGSSSTVVGASSRSVVVTRSTAQRAARALCCLLQLQYYYVVLVVATCYCTVLAVRCFLLVQYFEVVGVAMRAAGVHNNILATTKQQNKTKMKLIRSIFTAFIDTEQKMRKS